MGLMAASNMAAAQQQNALQCLRLLCMALLLFFGLAARVAAQSAGEVQVTTVEQLRAALLSQAKSVSILAPLSFTQQNWPDPVYVTWPLVIFSPYRAILEFLPRNTSGGELPRARPLIIVRSTERGPDRGSLALQRVFLRNFLPPDGSDGQGQDLTGYGPVPALQSDGGIITFNLVVMHFRRDTIWVFDRPESFWGREKLRIMSEMTTGRPLDLSQPLLYALKYDGSVSRDNYIINTCFAPLDIDGCYTDGPDGTTLVYCCYTLADSLRNPYVSHVRIFHDVGIDRSTYNHLKPIIVNRTVTYSACPTKPSINMDGALNGVLVYGSLEFSGLVFKGSRADKFTDWPPNVPLLLSLFNAKGDGKIAVVNSTVEVEDIAGLARAVQSLPGGSSGSGSGGWLVDPSRPDLQPRLAPGYSLEAAALVAPGSNNAASARLVIQSWYLAKASYVQYTTPDTERYLSKASSAAVWDFQWLTVSQVASARGPAVSQCFAGAVDQGSVRAEQVVQVADDVQLRKALNDNARYIQVVANITLEPSRWPSGANALMIRAGVVEVRACHPERNGRYIIDLSDLRGVVKTEGRLLFEGDFAFVNLGWATDPAYARRVALGQEDFSPLAAFEPALVGAIIEFEDVILSGELPSDSSVLDRAGLLTALSLSPANQTRESRLFNYTIVVGENSISFGTYYLFCHAPRVGAWSFMRTRMEWSTSLLSGGPQASSADGGGGEGGGRRSVPLAAVILPAVLGTLVLVAAGLLLGFALLNRRQKGTASSTTSDEDFEQGIAGQGGGGGGDHKAQGGGGAAAGAAADAAGPKGSPTAGDAVPGTAANTGSGDSSNKGRRQSVFGPTEDIDALRRTIAAGRPQHASPGSDEELVLTAVLGEGSYGKVYRALWRGTTVAVKVILLPSRMTGGEKREKMAIMEAAISSSLSHPNIVQTFTYGVHSVTGKAAMSAKLAGADLPIRDHTNSNASSLVNAAVADGRLEAPAGPPCSDDPDTHTWEVRLVQEYCDQGSLRERLNSKAFLRDGAPDICCVLDTAIDIARAVSHLHREGIIHADLKARNVLLQGSTHDPRGFVAKVADFGLSLRLDSDETHVSNAYQGTLSHMAPETLVHGHVSRASDVYAFGIMLYELYTGSSAYQGVPRALLGHAVTKENQRPEFSAGAPFDYQLLACRCWESNPDIRPCFDAIVDELKRMRARVAMALDSSQAICPWTLAALSNTTHTMTHSTSETMRVKDGTADDVAASASGGITREMGPGRGNKGVAGSGFTSYGIAIPPIALHQELQLQANAAAAAAGATQAAAAPKSIDDEGTLGSSL